MVPHPTCCKQLRLTKSSANFNKDLLFTRFVNFNLQQDDVRLEPQLYYRELICNCTAVKQASSRIQNFGESLWILLTHYIITQHLGYGLGLNQIQLIIKHIHKWMMEK